jgi:hypothetical protein
MGFNPTKRTVSAAVNEQILPFRGEFNASTGVRTEACCHHSDAGESCSSCQNYRLATDRDDVGDIGHSSTHNTLTMGEEWGPSSDVTGIGSAQTPLETGTRGPTDSLNTVVWNQSPWRRD